MKKALVVLATGLFLVAMANQAFAQDQPGGQPGGRRGNRGAGGPGGDPAQFMQRMNEQTKQELGVTDDEWKVIEPKLTKVQTLRMQSFAGGRGFGGGRGGRGGAGGPGGAAAEPTTDVGKATAALAKVLENKDAPAADIKTALQALREAKAKAKAELEAAQKELKEVLTARQEAVLVQRGTLD